MRDGIDFQLNVLEDGSVVFPPRSGFGLDAAGLGRVGPPTSREFSQARWAWPREGRRQRLALERCWFLVRRLDPRSSRSRRARAGEVDGQLGARRAEPTHAVSRPRPREDDPGGVLKIAISA